MAFGQKVADLGAGANYTVAKDEYTIEAGYPGSGVTVIQMIQYPRLEHLLHEFGHYLGLPHNYSGGLWSLMGHRHPNISSFMNSYERERLGWITFETISVPDTTTTLADLGYNGDVRRIAIPNTNPTQWYYLENHQLLTPYDFVEINGAPGLYILHDNGYGGLQVVAADGRWNWSNPYWIPNPYGPNPDSLPVYKKGTISRTSGLTDKMGIPHTKDGSDFIHVWIDEESTSGQNIVFPRYKGEGRDKFTLTENNVFSPWSGFASNTVGIEITGTPNNNINLKFYPTTPLNAPPSKPQGLVIGLFSQYGFNYPHLEWAAMQEPDVINGGNMEVWRRLKQGGYWGSWTSVVTNLDGDETEYIDFSVPTAGGGSDSAQYKIRAKDSTNKVSVYSEPYRINYSSDPWKIASEKERPFEFALFQNHPNPFNPATNIVFELAEPRLTSLKIYNILGQEVATLLNEEKAAGQHTVRFDASSLASGVYIYRLTAGSFVSTRKLMLMK